MPFMSDGIPFFAALLVALILLHLHRRFRGTALFLWSLSFLAVSVFHLSEALPAPAAASWRAVLSIAGATGAYVHLSLLAWGSLALASRGSVPQRTGHRLLLLGIAAGGVSGFLQHLLAATSEAHALSLGMHALVGALTFFASSLLLLRGRAGGFFVASSAIAIAGAFSLLRFALLLRGHFVPGAEASQSTLAFLLAGGSALFLLAAVLALLEDQRESNAAATSEVEHLAYHDTVTGLPNRSLFDDRLTVALQHAQRHRHKLAVLFLDVDRFKQINDSLGHTTGDRLLRTIAERIVSVIRAEDTVARFGGDEFTVLLHIIGKVEDAGRVAAKILEALKAPIAIDGREFMITSSIGIAVYPVDGVDGETLIRNADTAMYRAKENGRNSYQFYAAIMNHRAIQALELENGLRRAVENDEFVLYYQPLVDVASGTVYGVEALIRWQHPQQGLLAPETFISVAEESGVIVPIGQWVLREACRQASEWHRQGRRVTMAVNLSQRQFQAPDLLQQVTEALGAAKLRPQYLELEITEGYAMQDVNRVIATLHELKKLGVRIAIDDFGTGYSCLSYLKHFPIDTLKLDGSFLQELGSEQDQQIALGVIALAHSLNLKVIAEGVETISQLAFLRASACDRLQGYLFSRPVPPTRFDTFFQDKDVFHPKEPLRTHPPLSH